MLQRMSRSITPLSVKKQMISQTVEYALRAIVTIAQHEGAPCTSQQISEITQVPAPYLSKLLQGLVRTDLVTSKRGLHGGFVLTKDASDLTIWDIVDAVEPIKRIRECPLDIGDHAGTLCPLHRRLDDALALVESSFRETTVKELLSDQSRATPLCEERKLMQITLTKGSGKPSRARKTGRKKTP